MNGSQVLSCAVRDAPPDWPVIRVLALWSWPAVEPAETAHREAARQRARELLLRHAGRDIASAFLVSVRTAGGACRASISHERDLSLVAWCKQGCIGVDLVDMEQLRNTAPQDLLAAARLYLGESASSASNQPADMTPAPRRFAEEWARHEAMLKCLGLGLDEWSLERQARLNECTTAVVAFPAAVIGGSARWVAAVAWRCPSAAFALPAMPLCRGIG